MKVKVTKISACSEPEYPTVAKEDWVLGGDLENYAKSPFEGYEVTGELISDVKVGSRIQLDRDTRNGVKVGGYFSSSEV